MENSSINACFSPSLRNYSAGRGAGRGAGRTPPVPPLATGLHYLFVCHEFSLRQRRQIFINSILKENKNFNAFDKKSLFNYILSLNDCSIF